MAAYSHCRDTDALSATISLQQLTDQLDALEAEAAVEIQAATDAAALEQLRVGLLGKKGRLSAVLGAMGKLPGDERPVVGQRANVLTTQVQQLLSENENGVARALRTPSALIAFWQFLDDSERNQLEAHGGGSMAATERTPSSANFPVRSSSLRASNS